MGLFSAMNASISGMASQANLLATVSENISNSNTTGYKQAETLFRDIVDAMGATGDYSAGGVNTLTRYNVAEQGGLTGTTSATDLAIQGNGFFLVNNSNGATFLTRAGSFVADGTGNLVNAAGYSLMGYSLAAGAGGITDSLAGLTAININGVALVATALRANDDETNTCREFTLGGIGQTSSGYAPNQRQQDSCSSRR